jgi:ribosomal protein S18 acetylase RimI-like enzyme
MTEVLSIQRLPANALARLAEIDRSEHILRHYRVADGQLAVEETAFQVPDWDHVGHGEHSVRRLMDTWQPVVDAGGQLVGALQGSRLAGMALLRPELRPGMAQLALLYVSRAYRRRGVAGRLLAEVERIARRAGHTSLYVTATPSESAVGFYLAQGFAITPEPLPELFAKEPDDIHMLKALAERGSPA